MGEISSWTKRPTVALPAHIRGGTNKSAAVRGVKAFEAIGIGMALYPRWNNTGDISVTHFVAGFVNPKINHLSGATLYEQSSHH
jgi:hypothetical protein